MLPPAKLVHAASPAGQVRGQIPLLGRDRELDQVRRLVRLVCDGQGQIVILSGEAGIGKTRLITEALAPFTAGEPRILAAAGDELRRERPFGVLLDAVAGVADDRVGEVHRLLHRAETAAEQVLGLEPRVARLLVELVSSTSESGPVALVLDDLQWADESSLLAVKLIAALTATRPLLLVCAQRPHPAGRALLALGASLDYLGAHRLALEGISAVAAEQLADALAGGPVAGGVRSALPQAAGNPFFVEAIVAVLQRDGAVAGAAPATTEGWMTPSLRLAVLGSLRSLPDETLQSLRAAAIAGRRFTVGEVALITPTRIPDLVAALAPALQAGILESDAVDDRLAFRHDLIREALYDELAPALRRALHRELAARLTEVGGASEQIAAQLMLGADAGDRAAIDGLRRAGARILAASPATAAEMLWRARELAEESPQLRMQVLVDLVRPLMWTGQGERAEAVCLEALDAGAPDGQEPLFWMGLVNARIFQGRLAEARETVTRALECTTLTASDRLHLQTASAAAGTMLGDPDALAKAREIAATAPRSIPRVVAHDTIVQWELLAGHADRSLAAAEQAVAVREPDELGSRIWQGAGIRVRMWEALALLELDRIEEAIELLAGEISSKLAALALPHAFKAACHYHAGQYPQAQRDSQAATAAGELGGSFQPASAPAIAATIALRQGRTADADTLLARAEANRAHGEIAGDTIVRWTRALVLEAHGQITEAAGAAAGAIQAYTRAGFVSYTAWHAPDFVRIALAADQPEQAEAAAAAAQRTADQLPVASRRAAALRARGLLTDDTSLLLDAVTAARQAPRPLDLAHTLRDTAAALARAGDHAAARPLAREALTLLAKLGATGEQRSTRQLLRAAGLHPAARSRHTKVAEGWDSLTPAELQIIDLTAHGHTTPQIAQALYISPR